MKTKAKVTVGAVTSGISPPFPLVNRKLSYTNGSMYSAL